MLGAWALGIDYTGIDTNVEMKDAYSNMIDFLDNETGLNNSLFETTSPDSKLKMIWESALDVDFSKLDYDFVLTSPPYVNLEVYEHMTEWKSDEDFYVDFFIPLWDKCFKHIKPSGHVCFNISPKMYDAAISFGLAPCHDEEDLKQQLGQQTGKKKQDKIYIWHKSAN
jgi:DNA modification methylase